MSIVKSLSVGLGDMFYILHGTDSFTIIDCCMSEEDGSRIVNELKSKSKDKGVTRFISTHPDDDHVRGLKYLNEKMPIVNFYSVENKATKPDPTDDFDEYCALRDSSRAFHLSTGCSRKWLNEDSDETDSEKRGSAGIYVLWPTTDNEDYKDELKNAKDGKDPNNISPIVKYRLKNGANILWMGDLKTEFMERIKDKVVIGSVDVLFAPHHGRDTGKVPTDWLESMDPKMVIVGEAPSEHLHYYPDYDTITQNSAGDITLECVAGKIHVYVSESNYSVDFLEDEGLDDNFGGKYIGTLTVHT
jgi:beta-lactamase superfamily II metal-dependent hydrolase